MVDDETQDVSARPAGAPPNRDARPDPGVIDGEIAARGPNEPEPPPTAAGAPERCSFQYAIWRSSTSPESQDRCHAAKSAYWMPSSGSGEGRPVENAS